MSIARRLKQMTAPALAIVLLAAALPAGVSAQVSTPEVSDAQRMIIVESTGTVDVNPDTADVTLGVLTQTSSLEDAQSENSQRTRAIIDTLTQAGIANKDIATSGYSVNVINERDDNGNLVGVQGYEVRSTVTATIRDLSIVGEVLDDAVGAGANEVNAIRFYVDNTDEAASQAREQAITHARESAGQMAETAGVIVSGVYLIEELSAPEPQPVQMMARSDAVGAAAEQASAVPISPGQTEVTVKVRVIFEIEQPLG